MATASGYMFFLYPQVNGCLKAMLNQWEHYLESPDSVDVLKPDDGWLGQGLKPILTMGNMNGMNIATNYTFPQLYKCPDPDDTETYGFPSWDKFFTREFQNDVRLVDSPEDDSVIIHACESAPLQYPVAKAQLSDNFQGKNQCYSLNDMMNQNTLAENFVGGTVYQAFLSATIGGMHRSPVKL